MEIVIFDVDLGVVINCCPAEVDVQNPTMHPNIVTCRIIFEQDIGPSYISQINWRNSLVKTFKLIILILWIIVIEKMDAMTKYAAEVIHTKFEILFVLI